MNHHWIHRVWERKGFSGKFLWAVLLPLSGLFGLGVRVRNFIYRRGWLRPRALDRPVISIGNLTVGGTGKTPSCIWLAGELERRGVKVAILSRGHKRHATAPVLLRPSADGPDLSPAAVSAAGDEPTMMAEIYGKTIAIGKDRYHAAQELLKRIDVDLFLLDDGFQHRRLRRDIDIVLLGRDRPGFLLPSGPFREPKRELKRGDYFLMTGPAHLWTDALSQFKRDAVCFSASLEPVALVGFASNARKEHPLTMLYHSRILAVTGIANPDRFYEMIRAYEGDIVEILEFPDHHEYSPADWQQITRAARQVDVVVTTEKDLVKLARFPFAKDKLLALRVAMKVENGGTLIESILARIGRTPNRPAGSRASTTEMCELPVA